jgi:TPR repeat protein
MTSLNYYTNLIILQRAQILLFVLNINSRVYANQNLSAIGSCCFKFKECVTVKGFANAMNNLGILYEKGQGVTQDYSQAKYWWHKACDLGNTDGCKALN